MEGENSGAAYRRLCSCRTQTISFGKCVVFTQPVHVQLPPAPTQLGWLNLGTRGITMGRPFELAPLFFQVRSIMELTCKCYFYCLWFISKKQREQKR